MNEVTVEQEQRLANAVANVVVAIAELGSVQDDISQELGFSNEDGDYVVLDIKFQKNNIQFSTVEDDGVLTITTRDITDNNRVLLVVTASAP